MLSLIFFVASESIDKIIDRLYIETSMCGKSAQVLIQKPIKMTTYGSSTVIMGIFIESSEKFEGDLHVSLFIYWKLFHVTDLNNAKNELFQLFTLHSIKLSLTLLFCFCMKIIMLLKKK